MPAGNLAKIVASMLLALYLMAPGSVIVHILQETALCGHAEEPIHLEQPTPLKGQMHSEAVPCNICEQGDKVLPGSGLVLVYPPSIPAYAIHVPDNWPTRCNDPPFIPPELNV